MAKFAQMAIIVASLLAIASAASSSWGTKNSSSTLLYAQHVSIARLSNQYQTATVNFPASGQINTKVIHLINVIDRFTNGSGAIATLWSGGPNYTFATINLKSQLNQGINSTVEFFCKT